MTTCLNFQGFVFLVSRFMFRVEELGVRFRVEGVCPWFLISDSGFWLLVSGVGLRL